MHTAHFSRALLINLLIATAAQAQQFDIQGPAGSAAFGTSVTVLPNGNIVATDPGWNGNIGAVYLYTPDGQTLITTLVGAFNGDQVGSGGITVLKNGNYVVASPNWTNPGGGATAAGAVTYCNATTGCGPASIVYVNQINSLVGTNTNDQVGLGGITLLTNGNYVVDSYQWSNSGDTSAHGAITWCDGTSGQPTGDLSQSNSLVGATAGDAVGITGSTASPPSFPGVVALDNGNFVVTSPFWSDPTTLVKGVGAATWVNGSTGLTGTVSESNSLYGTLASSGVSDGGVVGLVGGNYVVISPFWQDGVAGNSVGAVTWGGGSGITGAVTHTNSLYGQHQNDRVGLGGNVTQGVVALSNGNYVVASYSWNGSRGAVTWGNGSTGISGAIDGSTNSLVGVAANDQVGYGVIALRNGNYVVTSPFWGNSSGATTWLSGSGPTADIITSNNSLLGGTSDFVGYAAGALSNGNYVVASPGWNFLTGAATWADGSSVLKNPISSTNSLIGSATNDNFIGQIVALSNGNYVVSSGATFGNKGVAAWGNGATGTTGTLSANKALIGSVAGDQVGASVYALSNGNYVVVSPDVSFGGTAGVGAVTWGNGSSGISGSVTAANSMLGTFAQDRLGSGAFRATSNGNYIFTTPHWSTTDAGAVTIRRGNGPYPATIDARNSVLGAMANSGNSMVFDYDANRDQLVVGRPLENIVTLFRADQLFKNGFEAQ